MTLFNGGWDFGTTFGVLGAWERPGGGEVCLAEYNGHGHDSGLKLQDMAFSATLRGIEQI